MEELLSIDRYQVYFSGSLSPLNLRSLTLLYQPLIGSKAYSLYLLLISEVEVSKITSLKSTHERLCSITNLPLHQIKECLRSLEAIGLLKTYVRFDQSITLYCYQVLLPLEPQFFFNNELLNVLLYRTLGELEYDRTRFLFQVAKMDNNEDEITAKFDDVFYIDPTSQEGSQVLKQKSEYRKSQTQSPIIQYDMDLFYRQLQSLQIPKRYILPNIENKIKQLGVVYHISGQQMALLVSESIENEQVDLEVLAKKARSYFELETPTSFKRIYHNQPIQYSQKNNENSTKAKHIHQLETWSPYKLIEKKQGGKPVRRDLQIVENLMTNLNLEPGVVNVLLELSWAQNDERIVRSFIESIGATWKRKNIHTVSEAMQEAKNYIKYKKQGQYQNDIIPDWFKDQKAEETLQTTTNTSTSSDEISDQELRELLKDL